MEILKIIYEAIDELNEDLEDKEIKKSPETPLFGSGDSLDSLDLINLITILEEKLEEKFGEYVSLADERAMSLDESPFKTVETLQKYIKILLNDIQ